MEILLAILVGVLYASAIYLILRRSLVKLILGLILLGNGANILIFLLGRISKGAPPIIPEESKIFTDIYADPIPQALILTAIVISFGLQSFAIILVKKAHQEAQIDDLDQIKTPHAE
ncbi:MAG: Na+/H+ antiporter subunit C [Luteibaculaceae bacterium]